MINILSIPYKPVKMLQLFEEGNRENLCFILDNFSEPLDFLRDFHAIYRDKWVEKLDIFLSEYNDDETTSENQSIVIERDNDDKIIAIY